MTDATYNKMLAEALTDLAEKLRTRATNLFHSGGMDPAEYEETDFRPVRITLTAALREAADRSQPLHIDDREIVNNLAHF